MRCLRPLRIDQGYCSGAKCQRFPIILGESGSWLSNPSIAPFCPSYDNGNLVLCVANEVQARRATPCNSDACNPSPALCNPAPALKLVTSHVTPHMPTCFGAACFLLKLGDACTQCMMDIATYVGGGGDSEHAPITAWAWCDARSPAVTLGPVQHRFSVRQESKQAAHSSASAGLLLGCLFRSRQGQTTWGSVKTCDAGGTGMRTAGTRAAWSCRTGSPSTS